MEDRGEDYRVCDWHLKRLLERRLTHVIYAVNHADKAELLNAECEAMCYFFAHLHHERFGEFPETDSGISRETCSNPAG